MRRATKSAHPGNPCCSVRRNLPLDDDRRRFIFSVAGQGGVGKTWPLGRFRQMVGETTQPAEQVLETARARVRLTPLPREGILHGHL